MLIATRRDSFCGKISVCNNLWQYGIKFSLTSQHTIAPVIRGIPADLKSFAATCRIVKGLKNLRVGVLGARPTAFNTVRFSEKLMERQGISVETLDLSEVFGRIGRLADDDPKVKAKLESIQGYVPTQGVPGGAAGENGQVWRGGGRLDEGQRAGGLPPSSAGRPWRSSSALCPARLMSMMSNSLMPSACETDMIGMIGMYVLQLAAGDPSAIVDWNNNFGEDPDKAVIFHCSNLPKHFFEEPKMDFQEIIAGSVGKD